MTQTTTSAKTCQRHKPAVLRMVDKLDRWIFGTTNLDVGGGKYEVQTEWLKNRGVRNLVYDPFNRSDAHNAWVMAELAIQQADTVTLSNLLNVLETDCLRMGVLRFARDHLLPGGKCYITVYEGNKSWEGKHTSRGWQENRPLCSYGLLVQGIFPNYKRRGKIIVATKDCS